MAKIMVFGSFVVDLMGRGDRLPVPGETVKGNFFKMGPGGKGFNQGVAAHKAGADVLMVTKLGKDLFTEVATNTMDELEMETKGIFFTEEHQTGIALISVEETGSENQILVVPGACDNITQKEILKIKGDIVESEYLLTQLETNYDGIETVIDIAYDNDVKVILNTAPFQPVSDDLLSKVYAITPNETEASLLTGIKVTDEQSAREAAEILRNKGVNNVVITLGKQGAYVLTSEISEIIPAYSVTAIDTTGAGDAFNGGFVTALSEGKNIVEAVKFGNAVGALSVQKIGTTPAMPSRNEIDEFINEREGI